MSKVYNNLEVGTGLRYTGKTDDKFVYGGVYHITNIDRNPIRYCVMGLTGRTWLEPNLTNIWSREFELVQDAIQVGDTVRRTQWVPVSLQTDYPVMQVGAAFIVKDIDEDLGVLYFHETGYMGWSIKCFQKVEEPVVERLAANVAAELLIEGTEPLQYYMSGVWNDVKHPHLFTIAALRDGKFRRKPKTIEINGVTVPAPLNRDTKQVKEQVWLVLVGAARVRQTYVTEALEHCWATKEDAQAVLDAMLLPFKGL